MTDECSNCGLEVFEDGYYISDEDIGESPEGDVGRIIKQDTEKFGRKWNGFKEEDKGLICNDCSYKLANKRSTVSNEGNEHG